MELTGKIVSVLPQQSGTSSNGNTWMKNAFVIEWEDNGYKQKLCLEVLGEDKWDKMKGNVQVGNDVLVKFGVSSREWNSRWFTSCNCFYCASMDGNSGKDSSPIPTSTNGSGGNNNNDDDEVPF